jgi:type II secretory pathway component PulF
MSEDKALGWTSTVFAILCMAASFATIEIAGDFMENSFEQLGMELPLLTKVVVNLHRYHVHLILCTLGIALLVVLQIKARRVELVKLFISIYLGILILYLCLHIHAYAMPYANIINSLIAR